MRSPDHWLKLVRSLMDEQAMSVRTLSAVTGFNRGTLSKFLRGTTALRVEQLEGVLAIFDHDLDATLRPRPTRAF